jgi:hypothetical protein
LRTLKLKKGIGQRVKVFMQLFFESRNLDTMN